MAFFDREIKRLFAVASAALRAGLAPAAAVGLHREWLGADDFTVAPAREPEAVAADTAQRAGLEITPDLEAAVDFLADADVNAGERAKEALENIRRAEV